MVTKNRTGIRIDTVITKLGSTEGNHKIPTVFVPLAPEKIRIDPPEADLLSGVFHIMWSDMPSPRTYGTRLAELISSDANYLGCKLVCTFPVSKTIAL